jgi:hypothetical protein
MDPKIIQLPANLAHSFKNHQVTNEELQIAIDTMQNTWETSDLRTLAKLVNSDTQEEFEANMFTLCFMLKRDFERTDPLHLLPCLKVIARVIGRYPIEDKLSKHNEERHFIMIVRVLRCIEQITQERESAKNRVKPYLVDILLIHFYLMRSKYVMVTRSDHTEMFKMLVGMGSEYVGIFWKCLLAEASTRLKTYNLNRIIDILMIINISGNIEWIQDTFETDSYKQVTQVASLFAHKYTVALFKIIDTPPPTAQVDLSNWSEDMIERFIPKFDNFTSGWSKVNKKNNLKTLRKYPAVGQHPALLIDANVPRHGYYDQCLETIRHVLARDYEINEKLLQDIHDELIAYGHKNITISDIPSLPSSKEVGAAREFVPALISRLIATLQKMIVQEVHPLVVAATAMYSIQAISPFQEANLRVSRIFTNAILIKMQFPVVIFNNTLEYYFTVDTCSPYVTMNYLKRVSEQSVAVSKKIVTMTTKEIEGMIDSIRKDQDQNNLTAKTLSAFINLENHLDNMLVSIHGMRNTLPEETANGLQMSALILMKCYSKAIEFARMIDAKPTLQTIVEMSQTFDDRCYSSRNWPNGFYSYDICQGESIDCYLKRVKPSTTVGRVRLISVGNGTPTISQACRLFATLWSEEKTHRFTMQCAESNVDANWETLARATYNGEFGKARALVQTLSEVLSSENDQEPTTPQFQMVLLVDDETKDNMISKTTEVLQNLGLDLFLVE